MDTQLADREADLLADALRAWRLRTPGYVSSIVSGRKWRLRQHRHALVVYTFAREHCSPSAMAFWCKEESEALHACKYGESF